MEKQMQQIIWSLGVLVTLTLASFARASTFSNDTILIGNKTNDCASRMAEAGTLAPVISLKPIPATDQAPQMTEYFETYSFRVDYPKAWSEERVHEYLTAFYLKLSIELGANVASTAADLMPSLASEARSAFHDGYASEETIQRLERIKATLWTRDFDHRGLAFMHHYVRQTIGRWDGFNIGVLFDAVFYDQQQGNSPAVVRLMGKRSFVVEISARNTNHSRKTEIIERLAYAIRKASDS
jgi:hypothetical protein